MDLEPFELHPADPSAIRAAGEDMTSIARAMIDQESWLLSRFSFFPAYWQGVASEELRDAPEPVSRAAQQSTVRHSWAGAVLAYWAEQVESFNTTVRGLRQTVVAAETSLTDAGEVTADARRRWNAVHQQYIVDGGERVARMLAEGPTSANVEQLRQAGVMPGGRDGVFGDLWRELVPPTSDEITLLNLNIGMGYEDTYGNPRGTEMSEIYRIAKIIADSDADIATLQEVWGLPWIVGDEQTQSYLEHELERLTRKDWEIYFSEATTTSLKDADGNVLQGDIPYGHVVAVQYGSGITSSEQIFDERIDVEASEPRRVLGVQVETQGGGQLNVANTHISTQDQNGSSDAEQERQIEAVHRRVTDDGVPTVVTGDFNQQSRPGSGAGRALLDFRTDGFTDAGLEAGSTHSVGPIDHVLTDAGVRPRNAGIVEGDPEGDGTGENLSDHDGILIDLEVPADR